MSATAKPPWLVTPEKVQAVVQQLIRIARLKKIILLGSYARGEVTRDSDLDVLVVTNDDVESPRGGRGLKRCRPSGCAAA